MGKNGRSGASRYIVIANSGRTKAERASGGAGGDIAKNAQGVKALWRQQGYGDSMTPAQFRAAAKKNGWNIKGEGFTQAQLQSGGVSVVKITTGKRKDGTRTTTTRAMSGLQAQREIEMKREKRTASGLQRAARASGNPISRERATTEARARITNRSQRLAEGATTRRRRATT